MPIDNVVATTARLSRSYWPKDESVALVEQTVGSLLAERARSHAASPALVGRAHGTGEPRRLTYAELYTEARLVATALLRVAEPGECVALWAPNVVEWPIVQYGAALAGVVLVALNPVLREHELVYALNHSRASVLLHADRSRDYDLAAVVAAARDRCPDLRTVISLSDRARWMAGEATLALPATDPDDPVMLQFTSGTTGAPKGVLLRHRSLVNVAKLTMESVAAPPGAVTVNPLPMFHTAACVIATLGPLWQGSAVILIERFEPVSVLETIETEGATVLFFVPTVLGALLEAARAGQRPAPRLVTVMGGGANVPKAMIESARAVFGASVHTLFGQTELAPVLAVTRHGDSDDDLTRSVGRPLPQVECKVIDPATGAIRPLRSEGEICARGYQQLVEYLHDPELTARAVDAEGWVHTGDLGAMDERGFLVVTGRLKDLIIRGGENIAPAEVESCLAEHPAVLEAAVIGLADDKWGETVAAVLRVRGGITPGLRQSLDEHCRARLARFKTPETWFVADELPYTAAGKVQKFALRSAVAGGGFTRLD